MDAVVHLKSSGPRPGGGRPDATADDAARTEDADRLLCAACGLDVARQADVIALPGRPSVEVHVNPHGVAFRVLTVAAAAVRVTGAAHPAFSWYPGYVWRIATCFGCARHLGWRYDAIGGGDGPPTFYGLDADRLRPG